MSRIRLTWDIGAFNPEKHYIYRSDSEISPNNLPSPIAEVGQGVNEYVDDGGIVEDETYHYFVAAKKKGLLVPAEASVEVVSTPFDLAIGSSTLIGGSMEAEGFFGEVEVEELFSGDEIASLINLSSGSSINSDEPWLKFIIDGEIIYVAKKPYRNSLSWSNINSRNAVYDSEDAPVVEKDGYLFRVTLITGVGEDSYSDSEETNNPDFTEESEWDRLIYRIHKDDPSGDPWESYDDDDIFVGQGRAASGSSTICQERHSGGRAVCRGADSLTFLRTSGVTSSNNHFIWRPVLRYLGRA